MRFAAREFVIREIGPSTEGGVPGCGSLLKKGRRTKKNGERNAVNLTSSE